MTIKRLPNGQYQLDIRPDGVKGKRVIKLFKFKVDAVQYERDLLSGRLANQSSIADVDNRRLNELIELWYDLHGVSLKSSLDTKNRLLKLSHVLDHPVARLLTAEHVAQYRKHRLDQGIMEATLNRELNTLKALFRELKRLSVIHYDSDILSIRKMREAKTELSYLSHDHITLLIAQAQQSTNPSLYPVILICLATGARWSEAERLCASDINPCGLLFPDTKNGHARFVPVSESLLAFIQPYLPFQSCYGAFRSAFARCGFTVPKGQLAHILRHTFASHFVMNGGNIRTLQTILGHSTLQMTMRYAHLAPDFLNQARDLNPLQSGKIMESLSTSIKKPVAGNS